MKETIARAGLPAKRWREGTIAATVVLPRKFRESTTVRGDKSKPRSFSKRPWNFRLAVPYGHKRGNPEAPGGREASHAEDALVEGEAGRRILQGELIRILRRIYAVYL